MTTDVDKMKETVEGATMLHDEGQIDMLYALAVVTAAECAAHALKLAHVEKQRDGANAMLDQVEGLRRELAAQREVAEIAKRVADNATPAADEAVAARDKAWAEVEQLRYDLDAARTCFEVARNERNAAVTDAEGLRLTLDATASALKEARIERDAARTQKERSEARGAAAHARIEAVAAERNAIALELSGCTDDLIVARQERDAARRAAEEMRDALVDKIARLRAAPLGVNVSPEEYRAHLDSGGTWWIVWRDHDRWASCEERGASRTPSPNAYHIPIRNGAFCAWPVVGAPEGGAQGKVLRTFTCRSVGHPVTMVAVSEAKDAVVEFATHHKLPAGVHEVGVTEVRRSGAEEPMVIVTVTVHGDGTFTTAVPTAAPEGGAP